MGHMTYVHNGVEEGAVFAKQTPAFPIAHVGPHVATERAVNYASFYGQNYGGATTI